MIKYDNFKLYFNFNETNPSFLNMLRRVILSELNIIAFDKIKIIKNTTIMASELIVQRIGLCPLKYSLLKDEEIEEIKFTLKEKLPKNNKLNIIYSKSLKSNNDNIKMVFENIPIIKGNNEQELELECTIKKEKGKYHSKNQCVSKCYFKFDKKKKIYNFILESIGNKEPKNCIEDAIETIKKYLEILKEKIIEKIIDEDEKKINIILDNETTTYIDYFNNEIMKNKFIKISSYKIIHPLKNEIQLYLEIEEKKKIKEIINDTFDLINIEVEIFLYLFKKNF